MRIGISGASGDIGIFVLLELLRSPIVDDIDVYINRTYPWYPHTNQRIDENIETKITYRKLEYCKFPLRHKHDVFFHLAGASIGYENNYLTNIQLTHNMLSELDVGKIVFTSSINVYGDNKKWDENLGYQEDNEALKAVSSYAASKIACEQLIHTLPGKALIFRCCGTQSDTSTHGVHYHSRRDVAERPGYGIFTYRYLMSTILMAQLMVQLGLQQRIIGTYNICAHPTNVYRLTHINNNNLDKSVAWQGESFQTHVSNKKLTDLVGTDFISENTRWRELEEAYIGYWKQRLHRQ